MAAGAVQTVMGKKCLWRGIVCVACWSAAAWAQAPAGPPWFDAGKVPFGTSRTPLTPGRVFSLYGSNLGPVIPCEGHDDPQLRETPNPLRPKQTDLETRIYPKDLCDTRVLIDEIPAGLLWVQAKQINFKVPQEIPVQGTVQFRVVYQGQSSAAVTLAAGLPTTTLALESPARADMPVWLKVDLPSDVGGWIRYPFMVYPAYFGCDEVEVRKDGRMLPRIAEGFSQAFGAIVIAGNPCGSIALSVEPPFRGRLPLHLQYRFDQPGTYEVRFIRHQAFGSPADPPSDWTRIEILPEIPGQRSRWLAEQSAHAPTDAATLLTDFLPGILGIADEASLSIVRRYLADPDHVVRQYAMYGLTYWPVAQAAEAVWEGMQAEGPSDAAVDFLVHAREFTGARADAMVEAALPYLESDSLVRRQGALRAVTRIALTADSQVSAGVRTRAATALVQTETSFLRSDSQTVVDYVSALGELHDPASHELLWDLANRHIGGGQAPIALTWRKDPADLPKLAQFALQSPSLPSALRQAYGEAALPYLETLLGQSDNVQVRVNCARELIVAEQPGGFAFAADAIENQRPYRRELIDFLRGRFSEVRQADDSAVLTFAKARSTVR